MRTVWRALILVLASAALTAQDSAIPVPATVRVEGVPPMPAALAQKLAPYGQFRRAQLLSWHPSRRAVVVSTATTGPAHQVHLVDAPGTAPVQLTAVEGGVPGAGWFTPVTGDALIYRRDVGGAETHQLWRLDRGASEPVLLTDGRSRNGVPAVAPRTGRLAFDSNRRNGKDRDLYIADPRDAASTRLLAEVSGSWEVLAWAPDERSILAAEMLPGNDTALWSIETATGKRTPLTSGAPAAWTDAQYAPDGQTIYAVSDRDSDLARVWRWRDGSWTAVTPQGDSVEAIALSPDGATLAVSFDRDASSRIELLDTATMRLRLAPALPPGQITPPVAQRSLPMLQWHASGEEVAFTFGSVRMFSDVFSVNAKTGAITRWTESQVGGVDPATLPEPEIVRWKSFDGEMISGVLYRPPARFSGPRPVIINIHGGPNDVRERPRFQGRSAYFLNEQGIAIIYPNVRGSFGFGRRFEKLDDGRLRENAVKDIGALLDWIDAEKSLDGTRVMVTGASYGGYMTYAVAQHYPGRIRCAFAGAAISDFVSYLEATEPGRQDDRRGEYGDERDTEMRAFLTRISPLTKAARIKTPLLIAHGRKDTRVPVAQAEAMYAAVKANGVPAWLVIYEDAGHENFPGSAANGNFNFYTWITFAEKYLLN
ncbi:MAG TPA: alpha/beta fold hydrolase [Vicinamibacterales bacterium]|nr:alpha/beta fold hydrolase [Vicinamibacterales bacterium]